MTSKGIEMRSALPTAVCTGLLSVCLFSASAEIPNENYGQLTIDQLPKRGLVVNTFDLKTLFFDADAPHGPESLVELPAKYLSVISYPQN